MLHGDGPASTGGAGACGPVPGIGGPRGSFVIPREFDWHLLVGDETALPAIGRRLEELPAGSGALVVVEVASPIAQIPLQSAAQLTVRWLHRNGEAAEAACWRRRCTTCNCRRAKAMHGPPAKRRNDACGAPAR